MTLSLILYHATIFIQLEALVALFLLTPYHITPTFMTLRKETFENILGKGENAGNQHFLHFPKCFQPYPTQISVFHPHLFCLLQMLLTLSQTSPGFYVSAVQVF